MLSPKETGTPDNPKKPTDSMQAQSNYNGIFHRTIIHSRKIVLNLYRTTEDPEQPKSSERRQELMVSHFLISNKAMVLKAVWQGVPGIKCHQWKR